VAQSGGAPAVHAQAWVSDPIVPRLARRSFNRIPVVKISVSSGAEDVGANPASATQFVDWFNIKNVRARKRHAEFRPFPGYATAVVKTSVTSSHKRQVAGSNPVGCNHVHL
jgi:hypothetical protein